jgi:hypothetical protein
MKSTITALVLLVTIFFSSAAQEVDHSIARQWNEVLLEAVRNDFARPTVHARNLFHLSAAMYDAWAAFDETAETYFLGRYHGDFYFPYDGIAVPFDKKAAQEQAISYAMFRLITHRFASSPGASEIYRQAEALLRSAGYQPEFTSLDYSRGTPAALGNYIAYQVIQFGLQDGSNEANLYANQYYAPLNDKPLNPLLPGNPNLKDPNRWQSLELGAFIDQGGNPIPGTTIPFLSPEWGNVTPFSMNALHFTPHKRDGDGYLVYHDPGPPVHYDDDDKEAMAAYVWTFSLVAAWSSHLDPSDGVKWDISPASLGNIDYAELPKKIDDYPAFYDFANGGDASKGYEVNPVTGEPYQPQLVARGDYTRVLAEFWADGPSSETPPGHWFVILNYVNDHPQLVKKFMGQGEVLDNLEWDIKAYFILGGTMHDVAIAAWGVKGYYDYIRPVSAIRWLSGVGQSSDPKLPRYHPGGFKLYDGLIESVKAGDPLAGPNRENVGKIKLKAWKGPQYVYDPATVEAGVDWILADYWWPYQRPSFVTPPFAGYVSGHSTYSRAAAEVLTLLTGSEYFPGGVGEFDAEKNEFLVFEEGPSADLVLQWARYQDASDQCSLSRIWGGIHPPMDDIRGRMMGHDIGIDAFNFANRFFDGVTTGVKEHQSVKKQVTVFPNPVRPGHALTLSFNSRMPKGNARLTALDGVTVAAGDFLDTWAGQTLDLDIAGLKRGIYLLRISSGTASEVHKIIIE